MGEGDIDGDGYNDILLGTFSYNQRGSAYAIFGSSDFVPPPSFDAYRLEVSDGSSNAVCTTSHQGSAYGTTDLQSNGDIYLQFAKPVAHNEVGILSYRVLENRDANGVVHKFVEYATCTSSFTGMDYLASGQRNITVTEKLLSSGATVQTRNCSMDITGNSNTVYQHANHEDSSTGYGGDSISGLPIPTGTQGGLIIYSSTLDTSNPNAGVTEDWEFDVDYTHCIGELVA